MGALIFLGALFLRFWKIDYGLPNFFFGDEGLYVYYGLNMGGGNFDPHFYPSLFFYLSFVMDVVYIVFLKLMGRLSEFGEAWALYRTNPTPFYVIGRGLSVTLGALTVPLTGWIGNRIFEKKEVGHIAAFFLCFLYLHVQYSQIAILDSTLTFFVVLCFLFSYLAFQTGRLRYFILGGLAGGLAVSTKYNGLVVLLLGVSASGLGAWERRENIFQALLSKKTIFFYLFLGIGFTAGTPYWFLSLGDYWLGIKDLWWAYNANGVGQLGIDGNWSWVHYLMTVLPYAFGWPLAAAGLLGFFFLARPLRPKELFFLAFPVFTFLATGASIIREARYMMPIAPFLCLSAAWVISRISLPVWRNPQFRTPALMLVVLLVIAPSLGNVFRYFYLKTVPDTRALAYSWLKTHTQPGDQVLQTFSGICLVLPGDPFTLTALDPTVFDTRKAYVSSLKSLEEYRRRGYRFLLIDEWHLGLLKIAEKNQERYKTDFSLYRSFLEDLENSAERVASFSPYLVQPGKFDPENVQYASRSLWNLKSLGPKIEIYRL